MTRQVTAFTRLKVYRRGDFRCAGCGRQFNPPDGYDGRQMLTDPTYRDRRGHQRICGLEIDHIIPYVLGGRHGVDHDNLQPLCTQCNCRKGCKV